MAIVKELLNTLYSEISPYASYDEKYVDDGYPHTNLTVDFFEKLVEFVKPTYIVECGSMLGGSSIRMAQVLRKNKIDSAIVCIDPFTGDVNMWDWEKTAQWKFLRLENGIPTIYKRFIANCKKNGYDDLILPINTTTSVGIKLLQRLHSQERISDFPNMIYLDSAHEKDETFMELNICWNILPSESILFGDDWDWDAVRGDICKFTETISDQIDYTLLHRVHSSLIGSSIFNGKILLYNNQWAIFKNGYAEPSNSLELRNDDYNLDSRNDDKNLECSNKLLHTFIGLSVVLGIIVIILFHKRNEK